MKAGQRIGVFDSGVGGLSVLSHIRDALAQEKLIYVADSAYMPYGCKPEQVVEQRCLKIAEFFSQQQCKAVVVACNTATAASVHCLRERFSFPVIGMEPAVKPAVLSSKSKVVGVLATTGTLSSEKFERLKQRFAADAALIVQPCPGLVEQIERGDMDKAEALLAGFLQPLLEQDVDTLVLGCTHYPFLSEQIRAIAGDEVAIVDSGDAIARELKRQLQGRGLLASKQGGAVEFFSTGDAATSAEVMSRLWGENIEVEKLTI